MRTEKEARVLPKKRKISFSAQWRDVVDFRRTFAARHANLERHSSSSTCGCLFFFCYSRIDHKKSNHCRRRRAARVVLKSYSSAARLCTSVKYQKVYSPWISNSICSRAPLVFGLVGDWRSIAANPPTHSNI
jgi:hypothetical protein